MISLKKRKDKNANDAFVQKAKDNGFTIQGPVDRKTGMIFYIIWLVSVLLSFVLSIFVLKVFIPVYLVNILFIVLYIFRFHLKKI